MPAPAPYPIHGRRLEALLACAANPQGLPPSAYPTVMPVLEAMGLIMRRRDNARRHGSAWLLTEAGQKAVKALRMEEPEAPAV